MLFNSADFLIFFPIVTVLYFLIPNKWKKYWLLAASYYFYMSWNPKYALLILFSTAATYFSGLLLERINQINAPEAKIKHWKMFAVGLCFGINLAILFFFKYFNFALDTLSKAFSLFHIQLSVPAFDIVLPVGISFYTFQALSYTMDVYRNEIKAEKNFFQYALFVSFFPQLVAGPIERSSNLLGQLAEPKKFNFFQARDGFIQMLWGFFLKIVIADRAAVFVNTVYGDYLTYGGWYLVIATLLFALQIYCDFYGYSVIAKGAAKILGIELMENFHAPYLATSVANFWQRWHISLTSWFRDYLYIPLGGSRKGTLRKYLNKLIVFLVSGLWHGANMTFLVWGGLNGLYQVIGDILKPLRDKLVGWFSLNRSSLGHKLAQTLWTIFLISFSWIFFRAKSITESLAIIKQIITVRNPWILFDGGLYECGLNSKNFGFLLICVVVLLFADYCKTRGIEIRKIIQQQDAWFRCLYIAFSILVLLIFGMWGPGYDASVFVYFQF